MMNRFNLWLFLMAGLFTIVESGRPATLDANFGPGGVNFLTGGATNPAVLGFNPALGSLTGAFFTYSASAVLLEGDAISSNIKIKDPAGTLVATILFPTMLGRDQQLENGSFNIPTGDLNNFLSPGSVDLTLSPFTACRGQASTPTGCSAFTGSIDGSVVYSYTPVSSGPTTTPEPASLALLGAGFIVLGLWRGHSLASRSAIKRQ